MLGSKYFFSNCNVDYVKDVDQWHQLRDKGIGGSDAGIVMNVSNYKTPYQLWEEKTGKVERPFITNEAIEKGNALEPIMFNMFKVFYSKEYEVIDTKNISLSSKQFPFLRANLDGALINKQTGQKGVLEIKSTTIQNASMLKKCSISSSVSFGFMPAAGSSSSSSLGLVASARAISSLRCLPYGRFAAL